MIIDFDKNQWNAFLKYLNKIKVILVLKKKGCGFWKIMKGTIVK